MVGCQLSDLVFGLWLSVFGSEEQAAGRKYLLLTTDNRPLKTELVPRARLELARLSTLDPKSSASANFATSAYVRTTCGSGWLKKNNIRDCV